MVTPVADEICRVEQVEWAYTQIQSEEKYMIMEHGGHAFIITNQIGGLMDRLVQIIETGTTAGSITLSSTTITLLSCFILSISSILF